jgi:hypothetical protein
VSDVTTAAHHFEKYSVENCGYFTKCTREKEIFDATVPPGYERLSVIECELDWVKTGPIMLVFFLVVAFMFKKFQNGGGFRRKKHDEGMGRDFPTSRGGGNSYYKPSYRQRY